MATLFDYIDWRGDLTFEQAELNEVDNLILSMIAYVDFDGVVPSSFEEAPTLLTAGRKYAREHRGKTYVGLVVPPAVVSIMAKAAKSRRFGNIRMTGYVNDVSGEEEMQFSAVCFRLDENRTYVAFRGTDDTLVGWKENFNMSFMLPVPAQLKAVQYLNTVAASIPGEYYMGGHSKGGNLAVYAAVKCENEIKDRILRVYSNDGPGFGTGFIEGADYQDMRGKICTIVPQSSVVGMLLEHEENYEVVKSTQSTGILQHNGFTWEVLGPGFIHLNSVTHESRLIDLTLKKWLDEMDKETREKFVDSLFETFSATNAKTLTDLNSDKIALVKAWNKLPPETRGLVRKCVALLIRNSTKMKKQ